MAANLGDETKTGYARYLPAVDLADGIKRIMGNKKLYLSLLGRFKVRSLCDTLIDTIKTGGTSKAIVDSAHAIKGTAANLSLPPLQEMMFAIESRAKKGEDCTGLIGPLEEVAQEAVRVIEEILERERAF